MNKLSKLPKEKKQHLLHLKRRIHRILARGASGQLLGKVLSVPEADTYSSDAVINPLKRRGCGADDDDDVSLGDLTHDSAGGSDEDLQAKDSEVKLPAPVVVMTTTIEENHSEDRNLDEFVSLGWWKAAAAGDTGKLKVIVAAVCRKGYKGQLASQSFDDRRMALVSSTNARGLTALHLAAANGRKRACLYLIRLGASPQFQGNTASAPTAFDLARKFDLHHGKGLSLEAVLRAFAATKRTKESNTSFAYSFEQTELQRRHRTGVK